jgi:hypothetical protein
MRRIAQVKGPLTFGQNQAKIYDQSSRVQVTFEDVAGVDEAKLELERDCRLPAPACEISETRWAWGREVL